MMRILLMFLFPISMAGAVDFYDCSRSNVGFLINQYDQDAAADSGCAFLSKNLVRNSYSVPPEAAISAGYFYPTYVGEFVPRNHNKFNEKEAIDWGAFNFFKYFYNLDGGVDYVDGSVVRVKGKGRVANANLATANRIQGLPGFRGSAFGGGAYFEITLKFDPSIISLIQGWPSFWALSLGGALDGKDFVEWSGRNSNFRNNVEVDIFEYLINDRNSYATAMHHWYGVYGVTCPPALCRISTPFNENKVVIPDGFDSLSFHKYGFLWVPATDSTMGSATFYFDRQRVGGSISWDKFHSNDALSIVDQKFSVLDKQVLFLIVGSGDNQYIDIANFQVWQKSPNANWSN